jgi:hypothetical protein
MTVAERSAQSTNKETEMRTPEELADIGSLTDVELDQPSGGMFSLGWFGYRMATNRSAEDSDLIVTAVAANGHV